MKLVLVLTTKEESSMVVPQVVEGEANLGEVNSGEEDSEGIKLSSRYVCSKVTLALT